MWLQTTLLSLLLILDTSLVKSEPITCQCEPLCQCVKDSHDLLVLEEKAYQTCEEEVYGKITMTPEQFEAAYDKLDAEWEELDVQSTEKWNTCMRENLKIPCGCVAGSSRKRRDVTLKRRKRSLRQKRRKRTDYSYDYSVEDPVEKCVEGKINSAVSKNPTDDYCNSNNNDQEPKKQNKEYDEGEPNYYDDPTEMCHAKCCQQSNYQREYEKYDNECWKNIEHLYNGMEKQYYKLDRICEKVYKDRDDLNEVCDAGEESE